jgi:aminopeptidase YwaD
MFLQKPGLTFLLLLTFCLSHSAQTSTLDTRANLRKHIEYLASDKLEGRRTGEAGAVLAAGYIANQFAKLGLKPGASDAVGKPGFMQQFPYVTGVELAANGNFFSIQVTTPDGQRNRAVETLTRPVGFSANGSVSNADVVYAGFGIVSTDPAFDDYKYQESSIDVRGKVVLIFDGNPDNDNPHSPFGRYDLRTKALLAKERGAVGMLVISRENIFDQDRLTRLGYDQSLGESALPTIVISRGTAGQILGYKETDLKTLEELTASKAMPGVKVAYGFRNTLPTVSFSVSLVKKQVPAYNIIGILPGRDTMLKKEAIVVGAHYDHLGHGGGGSLAANSTEIHHGADDNASGVAAIIEMARTLAKEKKNKRTIIFIAFSGEEEGLYGSQFYVNNPLFPLDKTIAMINLDMVGRLNENKLTVGGMGTASEWKELVPAKNPIVYNPITIDGRVQHSLFGNLVLQLSDDGFGPSDHSSFYGKKVPVLFFFTGTHNDYHKPSDTADKINYVGEEQVTNYVLAIERAIDQNPTRPTYTVAKVTMAGGRSGFNISLGTIPNYADSTDGLLLDGVRDDSPAAKAGVKAGDKVIKLAGHDIRNVMDYTFVLGEMKAGLEYEIVILRGGEKLVLKIIPVKR